MVRGKLKLLLMGQAHLCVDSSEVLPPLPVIDLDRDVSGGRKKHYHHGIMYEESEAQQG